MSYTAPSVNVLSYPSVFVSPYSKEGNGPFSIGATPASAVYPSANRAYYYSIVIPRALVIRRFWWLNGATVGTNNLQAGLYYDSFVSVLLGASTLSAGTANLVQFDDVADTAIGPGEYWLALWCDGTTATIFRLATTGGPRHGVIYDEDSLTGGLPTTATPTSPANVYLPMFGFTTRASP